MITKSENKILTWDDYERQNNSGSFTLWQSEVSLDEVLQGVRSWDEYFFKKGDKYFSLEFKKSELIGKSDYLKRILVIHRIEKLMPYFGGAITCEEWGDKSLEKYVIRRVSSEIERGLTYDNYHYLAFHTLEQRDLFFEHNMDLVKDYLQL